MGEELILLIQRTGFEGAYGILAFAAARPLGLLFGFQAFAWAIGTWVSLRLGIAVAIGLPTLMVTLPQIAVLVTEADAIDAAIVAPREFVIGFGLGLLASLPFFALQYAGAVTDAFRGESDGGQTDPSGGGTLQTFSVLYLVIGFAVFFAAGGLWSLVGILYDSYAVWPVEAAAPSLGDEGAMLVLMLLGETLATTVRLALPLLALLLLIEFAVGIAARLGRRTGFYDMAFPTKNLAAILALPMVAWFVHSASDELTQEAFLAGTLLERLIPGEARP